MSLGPRYHRLAEQVNPLGNRLLQALPESVWLDWRAQLEPVAMPRGMVVHQAGIGLQHMYFPVTSVVSVMNGLEDGFCAQIAMVGREGVVGINVFLGGQAGPGRAVVQQAGAGVRLAARTIRAEFEKGAAVMQLFARYTQAFIAQMSQTALCDRHHTPEQKLCRYLLLTMERLGADEVFSTHETIAGMLGLRRETVSDAAGQMQKDGVLHYRRGLIAVLDRGVLERRACECYRVIRREHDTLLPDQSAAP